MPHKKSGSCKGHRILQAFPDSIGEAREPPQRILFWLRKPVSVSPALMSQPEELLPSALCQWVSQEQRPALGGVPLPPGHPKGLLPLAWGYVEGPCQTRLPAAAPWQPLRQTFA